MVKVLVAFTKPGWQSGIRAVLSRERAVSATYVELGKNNLRLYGERYDVVFLETGPDRSRITQYLPEVKARYPDSRLVLVLDNFGITDIVYGHKMGISALLDESSTGEQLLSSLNAALRGDLYIASSVVKKSQSAKSGEQPRQIYEPVDPTPLRQLSDREVEVLRLVAKGMSNRVIASTLFISEKTVKNHLYNIFKKIGVTDRTKAALLAVRTLPGARTESFGPQAVFVESDS